MKQAQFKLFEKKKKLLSTKGWAHTKYLQLSCKKLYISQSNRDNFLFMNVNQKVTLTHSKLWHNQLSLIHI